MTNEKIFHVRIKDEDIQNMLNSKDSINGFLLKLITDYFHGDLILSNESDMDLEYKKLRNLKTQQEIRLKKFQADQIEKYLTTFGDFPSKKGEIAIQKGAREISKEEIANVIIHFEYIEKNKTTGEMDFYCKYCANQIFSSEKEMITIMTNHILSMHSSELIKNA